jgi:hypothetical protein
MNDELRRQAGKLRYVFESADQAFEKKPRATR